MKNITSAIVFLFFCSILLLSFYVEVPRISKASGYTSGTKNVAKINPQTVGVLVALSVSDRARVKSGDVLGEVTAERFMNGRSLDADQAKIVEIKLKLDRKELDNINFFERASGEALLEKVKADAVLIKNIAQELILSKERLVDLERQLIRQNQLREEGFVSHEAVEQKRGELVIQKIQLVP
jgi:multidrug resistance efflux pump